MIQRFVELGEGFTDLYELMEIAKTNKNRIHRIIRLDSMINDKKMCSLVVVLNAIEPGNYMPFYICREGIPHPDFKETGRFKLIEQLEKDLNIEICKLVVKSSREFEEKQLYYQYLIGVFRMNKYIPLMKF